MESAYLDYAMSVIVGRALPDARDGLKPVHRRTLYAMYEANNDWNKPYKKSARIVGDVLGKYHPHSGEAVYDALVRMAQNFSMRDMLVDGQGNFGSVDGDNPAAMRYTEVRMAKIAHTLLEDIDKDTVDFAPNYDGSEKEPTVLPARIPNLLVNGSSGIAVGMATNIPPHNLNEVISAALALLDNPQVEIAELQKHMPAPDFPTGGLLFGMGGVTAAYQTGRGRVTMRGRTHIENLDKSGTRQAIIIDDLPYQVNKAVLIARIAELARDKKISGITDLRDESDRKGIRVVVELRRNENAEVILNHLYKETQLQDNFSINMVALVDGAPQQLNLRELLECFLRHRREVVVRRAVFELGKARARAHLLEGYAAAVANVDEIVNTIKSASSPAAAEKALMARAWPAQIVADMLARLENPEDTMPAESDRRRGLQNDGDYLFSTTQAKAILDMRLARLTAMERDKIAADYAAVVDEIIKHLQLLASPKKINRRIADELREAQKNFATPRRSEIIADAEDIDIESLIAEEEMIVTFSHRGYVKRQAVSDYAAQLRGGRGKQAAGTREDDFISRLFVASTHDYLLIFTNLGRVYWKKVYELPLASRASRGRPIVGLLELGEDETVQTVLPVNNFAGGRHVIFATAKGLVKKTLLSAFSHPRKVGIIALSLNDGDRLINAALGGGGGDDALPVEDRKDEGTVLLFSNVGKAVRFAAADLRAMGRTARGVRGMRLKEDQQLVSMLSLSVNEAKELAILVAADNGRGKRTSAEEFATKGRGVQGVIALRLPDKSKATVIGAVLAGDHDDVMLITDGGVLIRTNIKHIRRLGRNTQGVRLINLDKGSKLVGMARIEEEQNGDEENGDAGDDH